MASRAAFYPIWWNASPEILKAPALLKDVAITAATRILLMAAGLVSSVVVVRLLGTEGRGTFFYWSTLAGFAVQLGNLGLPSSNTFLLARNHSLLGRLTANALLCSILVGVTTALVLVASPAAQSPGGLVSAISTGVLASGSLFYLLAVNLLVALKRYAEFNLFEVLNRYLTVLAVAAAAFVLGSPEAALAGAALASLAISAPLLLRLLALSADKPRLDWQLFVGGIGFALRAYFVTLIGFAVLRYNAIYLEWIAGIAVVGEWSIAVQVLDTIGILPTAVAVVLFPAILTSKAPYEQMRKNLALVAVAMLVICAGAAALGRPFIELLYGAAHGDAYKMLLYGLPSGFAIGLLSVVSQFLAAIGFPLLLIAIWIFGLLVEVALSAYLVPVHAGIGAMIALSVAHSTIFLLAWALAHRLRHAGASSPTNDKKNAT